MKKYYSLQMTVPFEDIMNKFALGKITHWQVIAYSYGATLYIEYIPSEALAEPPKERV